MQRFDKSCKNPQNVHETEKNLSRAKSRSSIHTLQSNADLSVLWAAKGNAKVLLNTTDYTEVVITLLDDQAYKKLTKDPTQSMEQITTVLIKWSSLSEDVTE